jgi:hypothetical protein
VGGGVHSIQYSVVTKIEPAISLEHAFREGIPYDGKVMTLDGIALPPSPVFETISRSFECRFPSCINTSLLSVWYDARKRGLCLRYAEGTGSAVVRGLPIVPELQRGQWVYERDAISGMNHSLVRTTPGEVGQSVPDLRSLGDDVALLLATSSQTPPVIPLGIPLYAGPSREALKARRVGNRKNVKPCIHYLKHIVLFRAQLLCGLELQSST